MKAFCSSSSRCLSLRNNRREQLHRKLSKHSFKLFVLCTLSHSLAHTLLQTNDFKTAINQAKELAINLPGGELVIEEQDEVIEMLLKLRDRKQ